MDFVEFIWYELVEFKDDQMEVMAHIGCGEQDVMGNIVGGAGLVRELGSRLHCGGRITTSTYQPPLRTHATNCSRRWTPPPVGSYKINVYASVLLLGEWWVLTV